MLLAAYVTLMNRTAIVASPVSYSQACDTSSKADAAPYIPTDKSGGFTARLGNHTPDA